MTGLFEALNARFDPGAVPEIRARPVSRFEGDFGGGIEEEDATRLAGPSPAPRNPEDAQRDPLVGNPSEAPENAHRTNPEPNASSESSHRETGKTGHEPTEDTAPNASISGKETGTPSEVAPRESNAAPETLDAKTDARASEVIRETREVVRELSQRADAPAKTTPVSAPSEIIKTVPPVPDALPKEPPAPDTPAQPEPPTIHIGRIEVRQPVKVQAPPAPPAPPRKDPPAIRRAAPSSRGSKGRLTDYLGWKA